MRKSKENSKGGALKAVPAGQTKREVGEAIRLAKQLQAVINLGALLENTDGWERAASEAESRLEAKRKEERAIDASTKGKLEAVAAAEQKLADVNRQIREAVAAVKGEPGRIIAEANTEAGKIVEAAKEQAQTIVANADAEAREAAQDAKALLRKAQADAQAIIDHANAERGKIDAETEKTRAGLTALEQAADEKAAELDGYEQKIEAAKAQIKKMLGG